MVGSCGKNYEIQLEEIMARQILVNYCPYAFDSFEDLPAQKKCPDFKYEDGTCQCEFLSTDPFDPRCSCKDPTELFGYNLTSENVRKLIKA